MECGRISGIKPIWFDVCLEKLHVTIPHDMARSNHWCQWPVLFRTYRTVNFCNWDSVLEISARFRDIIQGAVQWYRRECQCFCGACCGGSAFIHDIRIECFSFGITYLKGKLHAGLMSDQNVEAVSSSTILQHLSYYWYLILSSFFKNIRFQIYVNLKPNV